MTPKRLGKLRANLRVLNNDIDDYTAERVRVLETHSKDRVSCRRGCHHCCHMLVTASLPEVVDALQCAGENGHTATLLARKQQIQEDLEAVLRPGMTTAKWFEMRRPCVFLDDGECMAYESRPQACRTYNVVTDPDLCGAESGTTVGVVDSVKYLDTFAPRTREIARQFAVPLAYGPMAYLIPIALFMLSGLEKQAFAILERDGALDIVSAVPETWLHKWRSLLR